MPKSKNMSLNNEIFSEVLTNTWWTQQNTEPFRSLPTKSFETLPTSVRHPTESSTAPRPQGLGRALTPHCLSRSGRIRGEGHSCCQLLSAAVSCYMLRWSEASHGCPANGMQMLCRRSKESTSILYEFMFTLVCRFQKGLNSKLDYSGQCKK